MVEIVLKREPDKADIDVVLNGIIGYNHTSFAGPDGFQQVALLVSDPETGAPVGGLTGWALYDWFFVQLLHLPQTLRGQGIGTELMQRAEAFARETGLVGMWLDTFEFQARGFYEKLGFRVFGTIEDHPLGSRRYFMNKRFESEAPTA